MRRILDTLGGLWELLRIALRGRLHGAWWRWRRETAFGPDPDCWPAKADRRRQVLAYGRWVRRMKRL